MPDTLTITDNRTGKSYELPIEYGTYPEYGAADHGDGPAEDQGLATTTSGCSSYDPAFMNTASCKSAVTFIDGDRGILRYRGYPIDQLAENSTYLEAAYLTLFGELPTAGAARRLDAPGDAPHDASTRASRSSWTASTTTPTRWGCW